MINLARIFANHKIINLKFMKFATLIKMPSLSPTMNEGGIVEWYKKEGDKISAGDLICDVQTDKAVVGMEAEEDGIIAKIIKAKDSQGIQVGEAIAVLADVDEDWKSVEIPAGAVTVGVKTTSDKPPVATTAAKEESKPVKSKNDKLGPAVRRLLDTYGIDEKQVNHSGPHDILMKSDVLQHIDRSKLSAVCPAASKAEALPSSQPIQPQQQPYTDLPLSSMRQTIAKRMTASKSSVPHFYVTGEANLNALVNTRKRLRDQQGIVLSVNDFIVKAASLALRLVPEINNGLNTDGTIKVNHNVDISIAVASESGLITPIVFGADKLPLVAISSTIHELAEKARNNKLQPQEFMGGTFTISNLGMFGIKEFTAIINSPQAAILAVGAGISHLAHDPANPSKPRSVTNMRFTLCADARIIDEASASEFVSRVKSYLENPSFLLGADSSDSDENLAQAWSY